MFLSITVQSVLDCLEHRVCEYLPSTVICLLMCATRNTIRAPNASQLEISPRGHPLAILSRSCQEAKGIVNKDDIEYGMGTVAA